MFEWAHVLHRQIYDVLADERLRRTQKDAEVRAPARRTTDRGATSRSAAQPKSMELMEGQPYSLAFRGGIRSSTG